MAEILAGPNDWAVNDEERLADFLNTETGRRFIPKLAQLAPALLPGGDTNAILIRSGEVRGLQLIISEILRLAHSHNPIAVAPDLGEYPRLESDQGWDKGPKLTDDPEEFFKMQTDPNYKPGAEIITPEPAPTVTQ